MTTPAKPIAIPAITERGSRSPKKIRPRTATQTGMQRDEDRGDARRDGLLAERDEAHPAEQQGAPTIAESRHSRAVGRRGRSAGGTLGSPAIRRAASASQVSRIAPAMRNRMAAIRNGGIVSTPTAIADVRRAPHEVERQQAGPDRDRAGGRPAASGCIWLSRLVQVSSIAGASRPCRPDRGTAWVDGVRRDAVQAAIAAAVAGTAGRLDSPPDRRRRPTGTGPDGSVRSAGLRGRTAGSRSSSCRSRCSGSRPGPSSRARRGPGPRRRGSSACWPARRASSCRSARRSGPPGGTGR